MRAGPVARVALANGVRALLRGAWPESGRDRLASSAAILGALTFAVLEAFALSALLDASTRALSQLPGVDPFPLLVRLLRGLVAGTALLLLLGTLTTAVSSLFLAEELPHLLSLPVPHRRVFAALLLRSAAQASGAAWLMAVPAAAVVAARAPSPVAAAAALLFALLALTLGAGVLGVAGALLVVRLVPPRRARLIAATVAAVGLAVALLGVRTTRPERLLDPAAAAELLDALSRTRPPAPGANPLAHLSDAALSGLAGDPAGLLATVAAAAAAAVLVVLAARILAPVHLEAFRRSRETPEPSGPTRAGRAASGGPARQLLLAEVRTLARDAATPAQLGSLAAVLVLDLLNLRLLPAGDPAARDLVAGLQTALTLFLVSALSLRFAYPAVSTDGRSALLLRTLPLSPARHLLVRWAVRAFPSATLAVFLSVATALQLGLEGPALRASLGLALLGGLALPALHVGLGSLFPRYGASNPVSVALGPGGLFALALSTGLSLASAPVVSRELRKLLEAVAGLGSTEAWLLPSWLALALGSALLPLLLGARSLGASDVHADR